MAIRYSSDAQKILDKYKINQPLQSTERKKQGQFSSDAEAILEKYGVAGRNKVSIPQVQTPAGSSSVADLLPKPNDEAAMRNYAAQMQQRSRYGAGNIDLYNRPQYRNEDGSISTVDSRGYNIDGVETLLPSVWMKNGKPYHSNDDNEIVQHYYDTGEYLGKFNSVAESNDYAQKLHQQQEEYYTPSMPEQTKLTESEFNRSSAMQEKYGSYRNYLNSSKLENLKKSSYGESDAPRIDTSKVTHSSGNFANVENMNPLQRIWNSAKRTLTGGLKNSLGSNVNTQGVAYQGGQNTRNEYYNDQMAQYQKELDAATQRQNYMKQHISDGQFTQADVDAEQNYIDYYNMMLSAYGTGLAAQEGATKETYKLADKAVENAEKDIQSAKDTSYGGKLGEMLVDAGASTVQSSADAVASMLLTGQNPLKGIFSGAPVTEVLRTNAANATHTMAPFVIRAFGGGAQKARQEMEAKGTANDENAFAKQVAYGVADAAKEWITEKLDNIGAGGVYADADGFLDEFWDLVGEGFAESLTKSAAGRRIISDVTSAFVGEGAEEAIGDYLDYIFSLSDIYGGADETLLKDWKAGNGLGEKAKNVAKGLANKLYDATEDFVVGGLSGAMGGAAKVANEIAGTAAVGRDFRNMGVQNAQDFIDTGLESLPGTESRQLAQLLQQKQDARKNISNYELGRLYNANVEAIDAENKAREELIRKQNRGNFTQPVEQTANTTRGNIVLPTAAERGMMPTYAQSTELNAVVQQAKETGEVTRGMVERVMKSPAMMQEIGIAQNARGSNARAEVKSRLESLANTENRDIIDSNGIANQTQQKVAENNAVNMENRFTAVQNAAEEATNNGERGDVSVYEGGQRTYGQSAGERAGSVAETAGGTESEGRVSGEDSSAAGRTQRTSFTETEGTAKITSVADAKDKSIGDLSFGEEVDSTKYFGESGSTATKFREVIGGETEKTREAKKLAKDAGADLILVAGDDISYADGRTSRAVIRRSGGKKTIVARVDDSGADVVQLVQHELGHDKIRDGKLNVSRAVERFRQNFDLGEEEADNLIDTYIRIKFGDDAIDNATEAERQQAITELVCDTFGDIDELAGIPGLKAWSDGFQALKRAVQESMSGEQTGTENTAKVGENVSDGTAAEKSNAPPKVVNGISVAPDVAEIMESEDYSAPSDYMELSVSTRNAWKESYKKQFNTDDENRVVKTVDLFTDKMIANDAIMGYVPVGSYKYNKKGPLRKNIEYIFTFDMDTSCPRTFQFLNYRNALQQMSGRYLTYNESVNLLELMRAYGQQIPCAYCYVENKRVLLSASYNNFFTYRQAVMNAKTDDEAKKLMYSYKDGEISGAAQKVFDKWRSDRSYNPDVTEVWNASQQSRNAILDFLDAQKENGKITNKTGAGAIKKMVTAQFGITEKGAVSEAASYIADWMYDVNAGVEHIYNVENTGNTDVDQRALALHHEALSYAKSASSAKTVENYMPYTDQIRYISERDKAFINGMGGIRKHSSNDFRIDYVQDYIMFFADLAAGGWMGHTYTKSTDYVKIFGRTGDRINMSIAMYGDTKDTVRENLDEGMGWKDAKELRNAYKDAGVMAMVTSDAQLSYALNSDWVDMIIPFHASGLDKSVWYNLRMWNDYTSKQLERFLNSTEKKEALKAKGVEIPKGANAEQISALYDDTFKIKKITAEDGSIVKPHFFPGDTYVNGQLVPGHHNDVETYKKLCAEYGVHPRFYGIQVEDANGNTVDVTDHPGYLKLIKETSRTDSEQEKIKFNFDEKDDFLGMSPLDYAMQRMEQEAKNGGFENTKEDPYGIVNEFKNEYLDKDRPLGYLTDRAKQYKADREAEQQESAKKLKAQLEEDSSVPEETMDMSTRSPKASEETTDMSSRSTSSEIRNLQSENKRLKKQVEYWQEQTKTTKGWKADAKQESASTKQILKSVSSKADADAMTKRITQLHEDLSNGKLTYEEGKDIAVGIASDMIDKSEMLVSKDIDSYREAQKIIKNGGDYAELQRELGKDFFPDLETEEERAEQVKEVMDALRPVLENPYDFDRALIVESLANDIVESNAEIRQAKPTVMDKANAKAESAMERKEESLAKQLQNIEKRAVVDAMYYGRQAAEARAKAKADVAAAKQAGKEALAAEREKNALDTLVLRTNYEERMKDIREKRDAKIEALKKKYHDKDIAASNKRKASATLKKIEKHAGELSKMLLNPNDKKHILSSMEKPVAEFLNTLNFESSSSYDLTGKLQKEVIGTPTKRTQKALELKKAYMEISKDATIDPDLIGGDGADGLLDEVASFGDAPLDSLTAEQLDVVWQCVKAVEASVRKANKAFSMARFQNVSDIADAMMADNRDKNAKTVRTKPSDVTFGFLNLDNVKPVLFFHRFGETGDTLWKALRSAQDKSIVIFKDAADFTNNLLDTKTLHAANFDSEKAPKVRELERDTVKVVLGGKERTTTTAQLMELYVLMKRPQAVDHILKGGIRLDEVRRSGKLGEKIYRQNEPWHGVTVDEITAAFSKLTAEQIYIAEQMQKYASTTLSDYGNEASEKVYGYKKFREDVYWPIRTNSQENQKSVESSTALASIANIGMTKQTKPNASNSVMIGSIFDTFASHVTDMAKYAAYLGVSEDMRRLENFNFLIEDENGNLTKATDGSPTTMMALIDNVQGYKGTKYWDNLMQQVAMGVKGTNVSTSPLNSLAGKYKRASVMTNLRVVIQQPTAIFRAMSMIDAKYLIAGMKTPMNGWNTAVKYCPICTWKDWGYFDVETGREMKDVFFNSASTSDKIANAGMWLAGKADSIAWGQLWSAVEAETKATHKDVKAGSEEFYKICADRFNEVIDRTQVVDGVLQRSQVMRDADGLMKMATSFMAEPTTQLNMLMMAAYDAKHGGNVKLGRTLGAVVVANTINALVVSLIDALRDDDKDKEYWRRWFESLFGITGDEEKFGDYVKSATSSNLFDAYNPLGMIPYVKDIFSVLQGFSVDRMDVEGISEVIDAVTKLVRAVNGAGSYTVPGALVNFLTMVGKATGYGVYNLKRDLYDGVFSEIVAATGDYELRYEMLKFFKNIDASTNRAAFYDLLYAAKQNDSAAYRRIRKDMIDSGVKESSIESAMKKRAE